MRCSRRPDTALRGAAIATLSAILGLALAATPLPALAGGISIEYAATKLVADAYKLDARIKFDLGDEISAALQHGVELHIDVFMKVRRERKWLWDPLIAESSLSYILQQHPLSEDYVVTDVTHGTRHQFPSLEAALKHIGSIDNHPLVAGDRLNEESEYAGYIRAALNIEMLPVPLQPLAYVSEKWRMGSSWYEWVVR